MGRCIPTALYLDYKHFKGKMFVIKIAGVPVPLPSLGSCQTLGEGLTVAEVASTGGSRHCVKRAAPPKMASTLATTSAQMTLPPKDS